MNIDEVAYMNTSICFYHLQVYYDNELFFNKYQ